MVFGRGFESHRLHQFLICYKTSVSILTLNGKCVIDYSLIVGRESASRLTSRTAQRNWNNKAVIVRN